MLSTIGSKNMWKLTLLLRKLILKIKGGGFTKVLQGYFLVYIYICFVIGKDDELKEYYMKGRLTIFFI